MTSYDYNQGRGALGRLDWGAVLASVVVGLGVTLLLVALGIALGALASEPGEAGADVITAAVGGWVILSALIGTFVGTFVGGRFTSSRVPGSVIYHAATSWSLVTVLTIWFGATGVIGLLGSALQAVDTAAPSPDAAGEAQTLPGIPQEAVGWGGWALFIGLALTLAAAIAGWWVGARTRPSDFEAPPEERRAETEAPVGRERTELTTRR